MRALFSKSDRRVLSSVLAVFITLASLPLTTGAGIAFGSSQAEFTINICQPIQMFDRVSNTQVARPATIAREFVLCDLGSVTAAPTARIIECTATPDTPPPKRLV
jgi:hypothetical protein